MEVGSEMYATPESVEAPLPVPPPRNHSVEPPEYEVCARHRSRWLQGLHPYMYVGPSRGSRQVSPGHSLVRVRASGPSDRFPACHPSGLVDGISLIQAAIDRCGDGCGLSGSGIGGTPLVGIDPSTEDGLVGVGGVSSGGGTSVVARGHRSSGRSPIRRRDHAFDLSSGGF